MTEHTVLGQVALAYSPMIDRQRAVMATRLTVFPQRPDASPDPLALLAALREVWPADAGSSSPALLLNLAGERLLREVMGAQPGPQMMIEVPAFMAAEPAQAAALQALHAAGTVLLIKGRPLAALDGGLLALFSHCIVEPGEERLPAAGGRKLGLLQAGVRTTAAFDAAFQRGATAVLGWPWDDPQPRPVGRSSVPSDISAVVQLINSVEREEPVGKLEAVLRRDPTLAFRLLRYLNSPAFGLAVEINSFNHALVMLGYQRLKRWLALLLASSAKGANARPLMYAAVRRGLLMEELARDQGDAEMRGEMFICGVFSLLDRMLQQPFSELLPNVPVPERVQHALLGTGGPFQPYLDLVRAIEQEALFEIRELSETLLLGPAAVNRAVLAALQAARQLDG